MAESVNFCSESVAKACSIVIFGASGDLTSRKLLPAIFRLFERDLMPENFLILACARSVMTSEEFREKMRLALGSAGILASKKLFDLFLASITYISGDYSSPDTYAKIAIELQKFETSYEAKGRIFYFSIPPALFGNILQMLDHSGLTREDYDRSLWRRVVIEKPFGRSAETASELEQILSGILKEKQIYRIDHYLGKETVQNILMLRFANAVFEPLWNNKYIESIQICVSESVGVEQRAGYFEKTGLLRDMFQNHMLQILALVCMEAPSIFDSDSIRDEKAKLLRSLRPFPLDPSVLSKLIVRGQYDAGFVDGKTVKAYRDENDVASDSLTETYVAGKFHIDNWRWNGVHFYLRSGKRLSKRLSKVVIKFKNIPHSIFGHFDTADLARNELILTIQPNEGFSMRINAKKPGSKFCMGEVEMNFKYSELGTLVMEAYERLLLDCMLGDTTLFMRRDCIELSWGFLDPILKIWENPKNLESNPLFLYPAGSEGPQESKIIFAKNTDSWENI